MTKQGSTLFYFDSYGLPPDNGLEKRFINVHPPPFHEWFEAIGVERVEYNATDLQSINTDVCGQYSCYAALHGLPASNRGAWSWVSSDTRLNDRIIARLVTMPPQ